MNERNRIKTILKVVISYECNKMPTLTNSQTELIACMAFVYYFSMTYLINSLNFQFANIGTLI